MTARLMIAGDDQPCSLAMFSKSQFPQWHIVMAVAFLARIERAARQAGYTASMYGSVSRAGAGRDLDICFLPWHQLAKRAEDAAYDVANAADARLMGNLEPVPAGGLVTLLQLRSGHVIDAWFHSPDMSAPMWKGFADGPDYTRSLAWRPDESSRVPPADTGAET